MLGIARCPTNRLSICIPQTIPANWQQLQNQWEYAHATNFVFTLAGLGALLFSDIIE
ncbi:hypothetical protein IQ264_23210 [Phormidium sp. LEGE 05292]|uniref:hypothetical protein n=1 Tax=[Phormidium] sp. LEGE 05292 TaxID=767427 RepID=UPI0018806E55|nr:hypothetical protein [Phormidium sp. LEGE 05292]MBE9228335.1 hypothetical protein [Phormidium sp. LEGE 05292]